jgi:hypothetical protein
VLRGDWMAEWKAVERGGSRVGLLGLKGAGLADLWVRVSVSVRVSVTVSARVSVSGRVSVRVSVKLSHLS